MAALSFGSAAALNTSVARHCAPRFTTSTTDGPSVTATDPSTDTLQNDEQHGDDGGDGDDDSRDMIVGTTEGNIHTHTQIKHRIAIHKHVSVETHPSCTCTPA